MPSLGDLTVNIAADTSNLLSGITGARNSLGQFAGGITSQLGPAGVALGILSAATVGIGVASLKMAGDFQSGVTSLVTGAGEATQNIGLITQGLLDMSVQTGTSTTQLTDGLYMIESAGFHGAAGLQVLQSAAMGAKVGNADLASVANGVTTALTDYHLPASEAAAVTNDLIATVASGKTHMADLAQSLATILPTASAAGVGFRDVSAAMATMTGEGTPASDAATYLRQTLMSLENPAAAGEAALKKIGLTSGEIAADMKKSLPDTLKLITDHLKAVYGEGTPAYTKALADIAGGSRQMQGVLELTGSHLTTFKNNVGSIGDAVNKGKGSITGWAQVQGDFNFKMDQAGQAVNKAMIEIGGHLLPVISQLLSTITPLITKFADWIDKNHLIENAVSGVTSAVQTLSTWVSNITQFFQQNEVAMDLLKGTLAATAIVIGGVLITAFVGWAIAAGTAAIATIAATWPLLAIGAVIALVVAGIILAVNHWGDIMKWIQGVAGAVAGAVGGFFSGLGSVIHDIVGGIGDAFSGLGSLVQSVWDGIVGSIKGAINAIIGGIDQFIGAINSIHITIPHIDAGPIHIGGGSIGFPQIPLIPKLSSGVENFQGGLAYVHKDEMLSYLPSGTNVSRAGSGGGGDIHVHNHIYLDGREVTNQVMTRAMKEIRRNGGRAA